MQRKFTARDIHRLLGIDRNTLFYWINTHRLLRPRVSKSGGTGKKSIFDLINMVELALIRELVIEGLTMRRIASIKATIERNKPFLYAFLIDHKQLHGEVERFGRRDGNGHVVVTIEIGKIVESIVRKIKQEESNAKNSSPV